MKRYRFDLDPVLRVRRIQQDAVQALVGTARLGYESAQATLDEAVERHEERSGGATVPLPARQWLAGRSGAGLTAASVMAAGVARAAARTQMDEHLDELRQSRMRVTALERLDERRRDEHAIESQRAEEAEVDELVTGRHRMASGAMS